MINTCPRCDSERVKITDHNCNCVDCGLLFACTCEECWKRIDAELALREALLSLFPSEPACMKWMWTWNEAFGVEPELMVRSGKYEPLWNMIHQIDAGVAN